MSFDIQTLFPDLEALTPDGRWNALQDWLKENPEYQERVEEWATRPIDYVFNEVLILASKKYGVMATMAFAVPAIAAKIKSALTILQALYRERANQQPEQQKEIKHGRKRNGRKNSKRISQHRS